MSNPSNAKAIALQVVTSLRELPCTCIGCLENSSRGITEVESQLSVNSLSFDELGISPEEWNELRERVDSADIRDRCRLESQSEAPLPRDFEDSLAEEPVEILEPLETCGEDGDDFDEVFR